MQYRHAVHMNAFIIAFECIHEALANVMLLLPRVYRALLSVYRALLSVYWALLSAYRALLSVCRALLNTFMRPCLTHV